ncbi:adenylate cyclase [Lysobacter niastensis]|uniref:Adenylate cyclase n=1 Tax=Lysobacter niastensis TaxID=380629 RepID=A0ABU1W6R8_9GAMM|nr:TIR domain-containing protein [Lysobacter niastensis]MDR7133288.1 adenylate cyclase [Lysobacter niastensis]
MADVFVSYARSDKPRVAPLVAAIEARGWSVWWDPEIATGQDFDRQIAAELKVAKAVLVVWTPKSVESRWVRGEAREAAERGILVPVRFEQASLPIDVRTFHTTDLDGSAHDASGPRVQEVLRALEAMIAGSAIAPTPIHADSTPAPHAGVPARVSICVLPFVNMSGDAEQEYFSDGITEDIITDLSKVSALAVTSRNSAFVFKGQSVDVLKVARELRVSHVLEGSVRKAGGRVRITAQLVDGASNDHVWAERYDRDLSDIFALQDEISQAIVKALKLKLLPEEKKAIEQRGTGNAEAYNLYLMARQLYVTGHEGDARRAEAIIRLCVRATEIDPGYARAWALMAFGQMILRYVLGGEGDDGLVAADRALALDASLAEAHAVRARVLADTGREDEASAEIDIALDLDPESYEVNRWAAYLSYRQQRLDDAIRYFEKSTTLMDSDLNSAAMLVSSYTAVGNTQGTLRAARITLARSEKALAQDPNNGTVLGYSAYAHAALGEAERAKERMNRALLIDPDNWNMRYNFGCVLIIYLKEIDAALDLLGPVFDKATIGIVNYAKGDPDFAVLRDHPRFQAMIAAAEARLGAEQDAAPARE